jgi:hypothetical protein
LAEDIASQLDQLSEVYWSLGFSFRVSFNLKDVIMVISVNVSEDMEVNSGS